MALVSTPQRSEIWRTVSWALLQEILLMHTLGTRFSGACDSSNIFDAAGRPHTRSVPDRLIDYRWDERIKMMASEEATYIGAIS